MLVSRRLSVKSRIAVILLLVVGLCLIPLSWYLGVVWGYWQRPHSSSTFGVVTGIAGGLIVFFEMLLWPRKWLRGWRLGATKIWMQWHVWLGFASLPVIILHSGFFWGGPLSTWTMALFLIVFASGVWGLILQQWLPNKIRQEIPDETIGTQVYYGMRLHCAETRRIVNELTLVGGDEEAASAAIPTYASATTGGKTHRPSTTPIIAGPLVGQLRSFQEDVLEPYLVHGKRSQSLLSSRHQAEKLFQQMRTNFPLEAHPAVNQLEKLCELRSQWDKLRRYQAWLHNWQLVHVPISLAMTVMMCVHAWLALKLW